MKTTDKLLEASEHLGRLRGLLEILKEILEEDCGSDKRLADLLAQADLARHNAFECLLEVHRP